MDEKQDQKPRDKHGFLLPRHPTDEDMRDLEQYEEALTRRSKRWQMFLTQLGGNLERVTTDPQTLKALCRKGIPNDMRAALWPIISGATQIRQREPEDYYERTLKEVGSDEYVRVREQIEMDLPRTFPDHPRFDDNRTVDALRNVLSAYAVRSPEVGYCQSMNFIAGVLLLYFNEQDAFWALCAIIEKLMPPHYYTSTMRGCHTDQRVLEELVRTKVPRLHAHLAQAGVPIGVVSTRWFLCLFINVLPMETTLRVWDCFLLEGSKVLFRVALALFRECEPSILQLHDAQDILVTLMHIPEGMLASDRLLKTAFRSLGSFPMRTISSQRTSKEAEVQEEIEEVERRRKEIHEMRAAV